MRLKDLLAIPYRLRAETIDTVAGASRIRLSYPELAGCVAEGVQLSQADRDRLLLAKRRINVIVDEAAG